MSIKSLARLFGFGIALGLISLSSAKAVPLFTYDVNYSIVSETVTGDIVLNCNSCSVSALSLVSWSFTGTGPLPFTFSGTTASFSGTDLSATPSSITFTPTTSAFTVFGPTSFVSGSPAIVFGQYTGTDDDIGFL
jgi:hypothetical protein